MADPFGMFDGGNNGLDDLALGVPFTSFNSPSSQVQDRLQVPQSFPGFPQNSQPNANQQNLQKLQHFDERGLPTGPSQFLQHAPHQKLQHFGNDPVLSSATHQPFPSMQQNSQPQFTQLQPRSAEQFVPNRTQISMPQWSQGANSPSNHPSYNMQRTPRQPFQQAPFRQPFGYGFPRASSPNPRLQHFAQNQDPTSLSMNSPQSERFLSSHSPKLQAPNQTGSLSFSNLSSKDSSAKQTQQISPSQQQQTSPQQALRHYSMAQDMKINQQELTHGRLHHLPVPQSSSPGSGMESQQAKPTFPNLGDNTQSFNPFFGGPESMGMHRNSPNKLSMDQQVPFSSHQFQNASVDPFMSAQRPMNDNRNMYPGANQHPMSVVGPPGMRYPFQEMAATPQELLHLKTSAILLQMQRLQQEIQRLRESNIDPQHPQLQQMQHQFSQLYRIYVVQEQQRMQHGYQIQQGEQARMMRQQQPQDKANRIAVEALARAALHNNEGQGHSPMNFPPMSMMQHGAAASNIPRPVEKPPKSMDPIKLPPSIVQKPPSAVWNTSSRPPATVLAKPSPIKNRRESSDAEPTPPSSPVDMVPEDTVSSITRRSLRECRKKTYKDDFDYNLSDEEGEKDHPIHLEQGVAGNSQVLVPGVAELPAFEEVEETMIVEKILSTRQKEDKTYKDKEVEEFLVKFKNYSYLHCEWAVVEKLARGDKRIQMKIKRYRAKQLTALSFLAEIDDEPFNPDYIEVDRVLDVSTGVEQGTGETITHYLVKWRSLPYEDSTWELEADVDEVKIKQFYKTREPLPPATRQYCPRPYPHEWQKLDSSMVYRNQNTLREYQLEGLNWLIFSWLNRQNSILADEMGLGKTIQSIAFLCELQRYGIRGPFLVIAPLSTISNWQREFETWSEINCVVYHGSSSSRHLIQEYEFYYRDEHGQPIPGIFKFEALVTTYEIIIADNVQLSTVPWRSVIIDEAHRLKNRNCKLLEGLNNLNMEHRVLLTGTPLQNNVEELFSLLNFLEPSQFPSQHIFLMEFGNLKTENQVEKLKLLLKPMMLRRLKEDVEKNIAPKEETIIEVELTTIQKKYYRAILERNFAFLSKGAGSTANVPNLMNTMMELRKCCNHPFLINGAEEKIIGEYNMSLVDDRHTLAMIEASGKLVLIDKLLPKLKIGGHRVLVFSQMVRCLDILEDYLVHRRYPYERIDGRVRGNMRQAAIDRFCKPDSDRFVFLLCTRAGGLGINLTAADTVIIFDSDWNPQNDLQAQARCHRIGQDKSVKVYRLITRNSYEREMFDKASLKLGLDKAVLQSMNTKENASNAQGMHKREIEDLLRRGAYGAVMDDDNDAGAKFCEEDIDQILERRTQVIQIESQGKGSTFAKASFVSAKGEEDIDIDDPNFWQKWAKKAELDVDYLNKDDRIIDAPRQRKQTKRFGNEDADYELSDLDLEEEDVPVPRRNAWTRVECFRVEKNLLIYGWGRWKEVLSSGRFKSKLAERDVEAMSRTIILYCLHHYRGDDKVKSFIRELIKLSAIKERLPSEERDATYSPVVTLSKGRGRIKKGRGSKNANKSATALFEVGSDWRSIDPETLIVDEGYKKHLQHHCNKILLRVRLLFYLKNEVMGLFGSKVREGCNASKVEITIHSPEGDPPTDWWDEEADKSLLIGVFKYGYENYNLMRVDPTLCFLSRLGMPNHVMERTSADTTDPDMEAAEREEYEEKDDNDPDYQPELHSKKDSRDDEDIDDEEDDKESASAVSSPATEKANESGEGTTGLRWPTASDMNTRLRRLIAGYQRVHKKQELKKVAAEKERERKEKFEEAIRQKELKKLEMAQKWSKREEVDFYRTVSTFGVEYDKNEDSYDWTKFRSLARLDKKNDDRLTEYYRDFMAMCRKVCGKAMAGDVERAKNVEAISEERANRCLHRIQLLSRIREDVLPHEKLDERLQLAKPSSDFPSWWECGKHDKDMLVGVSKHGISRTDYHLLSDPDLCFVDVQTNVAAQQPTESPHGGVATERSTPVVPMSAVSSLNTGQERHDGAIGAIQEHTKKSLLQHILTSDSMINSKTMSVDQSVTECEDQSMSQESAAPSDSVLPKVEKPDPAGTVGHPSISPRLGNSPGREIKSEGMPLLDESGGHTSNQIDNSESIQLDGSAVKQESMSVDEEVSSFRGTPVSVNPMLMMDEDSQHNFSQDGLSSVGDSTMVSIRWPKDKVIMQRLDQLCDLVINGEWPVIEKPDLLQMQMAVPSPTLAGFSGLGADLDMGGVAPSFCITGEDGENPSKAFKVKRVRLEGLKLTFKKNKRKRKKDGEIAEGENDGLTGERPPQKEPGRKRTGRPVKKRDGELPSHTDTHQHGHSHHHHHHHHHHNPHTLNVDSEFAQAPEHLFNVHPDMGQKPRKKRARKEKTDKPDKPSTGRKRGPRKPKGLKLGSAGDVIDSGGQHSLPVVEAPQPWAVADREGATQEWPTAPVKVESSSQNWAGIHSALKDSTHSWPEAKFGVNRAKEWSSLDHQHGTSGPLSSIGVLQGRMNNEDSESVLKSTSENIGSISHRTIFGKPFDESQKQDDPSSSTRKEEHVIVVERETGRRLSGKMAPTFDRLGEWLEANPSYDVGEESAALVRAKDCLPVSLMSRLPRSDTPKSSHSNPSTPTAKTPTTPRQFFNPYSGFTYDHPMHMQGFQSHSMPFVPYAGMPSSIFTMPNFGMAMGSQDAPARGFDVEKQKSPVPSSTPTSLSSKFVYGNAISGSNIQTSTVEARYKSSASTNAAFPFLGFNGNGLSSTSPDKSEGSEDDEDEGGFTSSEEDTLMNYHSQDLKKMNTDSLDRSHSPSGDNPVIAP